MTPENMRLPEDTGAEPAGRRPTTRRQFVKGLGVLAVLGAAGTGAVVRLQGSSDPPSRDVTGRDADRVARTSLDDLADNVVSGGPGKDGIPAIDKPQFVAASDVDFLDDEVPVFGLVHRGEVRCYPQLILVWHEIVNDTAAGEPLSVTYCPLTGSVVGFLGGVGGRPSTFGTTGSLVNSNLLMYDRATDSQWPQMLGIAIRGQLRGERLRELPLVWASWGRWRSAHPDTLVLSTDTGHLRTYGDDPYGSYTPLSGYYAAGDPIFPVLAESEELEPKEVVVGIKAEQGYLAVRKSHIERLGTIPLTMGRTPLLAVWDAELATARVFVRRAQGRTLQFEPGERQDESGSTWSPDGRAVDGPQEGAQLQPANFMDAMWFAWHAFYPGTELVR
jgi:hypothetical protein